MGLNGDLKRNTMVIHRVLNLTLTTKTDGAEAI